MKKTILFTFSIFVLSHLTFAQSIERSVIGSAGSFVSSGSVQLSWTVGETVVNTASAGSVILTQGFQQPNQANSAVKEVNQTNLTLYPNPSTGMFQVSLKSGASTLNEQASAFVYDGAGKQVAHFTQLLFNNGSLDLDLSHLPGGLYTLQFQDSKVAVGTFKLTIIK